MIKSREDILGLLAASPYHMQALRAVRELGLPDGWIAAGFVRNYVWDARHGYTKMTPLNDIDVIYFDPANRNEGFEKAQEDRLAGLMKSGPWSVKNQARMHIKNGDAPYLSLDAALCHWCETVTPIAVRLENDGRLSLRAPLGLDDLLNDKCRATPFARNNPKKLEDYRIRMREKRWGRFWPRITILDMD